MNLTSIGRGGEVPAAVLRDLRVRFAGAVLLLTWWCVVFLGLSWDIQFHVEVGPDSFSTAPHLMMYSGAALSGLTCLVMAVVTTYTHNVRRTERDDPAETSWLFFRAPIGFIMGGLGALSFAVAGTFDLFWHTLYGFDPILWTPPHLMLFLSAAVSMLGAAYAFAMTINRSAEPGGVLRVMAMIGLAFALMLACSTAGTSMGEAIIQSEQVGPWIKYPLMTSGVYLIGLMAVASYFRRTGAATFAALLFMGIRMTVGFFGPWATRRLAEQIGMPFKAVAPHVPMLALFLPVGLILAGPTIDLALYLSQRVAFLGRNAPWLVGALGAVALYLADKPWISWLGVSPFSSPEALARIGERLAAAYLPTLAVIPVLGVVGGLLGWYLGLSLRHTRA